jgi:hypothetical protein
VVLSAEGCAGLGRAERAGTLGGAVPVRGDVAGRHGDGCLSFVVGVEILSTSQYGQIARQRKQAIVQCGGRVGGSA